MSFDNRWNQHTNSSLMLIPFGLWAPGLTNSGYLFIMTLPETAQLVSALLNMKIVSPIPGI